MGKNKLQPLEIDFSTLMDLRIDYAFKILFTKGEARLLMVNSRQKPYVHGRGRMVKI